MRGRPQAAGLADVRVEVRAGEVRSLEFAERRIHLIGVARAAAVSGTISAAEAEAWEADLAERDRVGAFTVCSRWSLQWDECLR